jgi:Na+-driven multidrug efflux pump
MAQLIGKQDSALAKESSKQTLYITTILATILTVVIFIFRTQILNPVFGKVDNDVMQHSQTYFFFTVLTYPFVAISGASAAVCRAEGETKNPMIIALIANLVNVGGNALFIYGFNMGVAGAAIATLISNIVHAIILSIFTLSSKKLKYKIENVLKYKPNGYLIKRICAIGVPNGFENSMFHLYRLSYQLVFSFVVYFP